MSTPACPICSSANTSARAHHGRAFDDLECRDCGAWWRADHLSGAFVAFDPDLDHDADEELDHAREVAEWLDAEEPAPPTAKRPRKKPAKPAQDVEEFDPDKWFGADGWSPWRDDSDEEAPRTPTCRPFVESTNWDFRREAETPPEGHLRYRGACTGCDWHGPIHFLNDEGENGAAEDANDHAFPGWRQLPAIPEGVTAKWDQTYNDRQRAAERDKLVAKLIGLGYPEEWTHRPGAPIRTLRANDLGMRHVPDRSPFGGYDLAVHSSEATATPGPLFAASPVAAVRQDIIERYSTSAEQQDEAEELLDDADLVGHLAGLFDELEEQIEKLPDGPQRVAAIECRDTALADLEAMVGAKKPAQLELAL